MTNAGSLGPGFLSFNSMPPRLHITGDDPEFDPTILQHLADEGFRVKYMPLGEGGKAYIEELRHLPDELELGESYAILAYGDAAAECLEYHIKPQPHLAALIAYYPTTIKTPTAKYPPHLKVLCHLAANQGFSPVFHSYAYQGVEPGFAEHDLDDYNNIAASLAWSRTLGVLRDAFDIKADLESVRDQQLTLEFITKNPAELVRSMDDEAYVNHIPTMTGGLGQKELFLFYRDYFLPCNPPSFSMKLISRTVGVDRVVDEMVISFVHTQEVPWILPGVPPTDKKVTVALVSIVRICGGVLQHEHVYWDQASVLVQVGLLNPGVVPEIMKQKGLQVLPVVGAEGALKVLDESSQESNKLLSTWRDRSKGDPGVKMPSRPKDSTDGSEAE